MTAPDEPQPAVFQDEMRRVTRLRWLLGGAILVSAVASGAATGWTAIHLRIAGLAAVVLLWNAALEVLTARPVPRRPLVWAQVLPDVAAMALLTLWTGGPTSPVLLAFVVYLVLVSLVLTPARAYVVAGLSIGLVWVGTAVTGTWPAGQRNLLTLVAWTATLLLSAYLISHIIRGLGRREEELRRQTRTTRSILDTAADGIITIDEHGVMRTINPAAERIFGYAADEIVGRNVSVLMPEPYRSEHDRYLSNYYETGVPRIIGIGREVIGQRKNGEQFPLELAVSEVATGNGRLFTGIVRDITERRRAEDEVRKLNETLLRHQETVLRHEKMIALGRMAAGVAHEIANPLASMDSLLQLVIRHPDRLQGDTAATLRKQIERIDRLVRQMNEFTHGGDERCENVAVNDLVARALEMIRYDPRTRRARIERRLDEGAGVVHVMPHAIEQVVVNLVINGLDAVAEVEDPTVTVSTRAERDGSVISVRDNGPGIPPGDLSRVFEPFYTTKPVGKGTGLGLSISYSLVERSDGRIEVESRPGEETVFAVHLPGRADAATQRRPEEGAGEPLSGPAGQAD